MSRSPVSSRPIARLITSVLGALAAAGAFVAVDAQQVGNNVNIVSGTTLPGGDPFLQRQNEPSGALSTRNPLHILAGANDYRTVDIPGLPEDAHTGDAWLGLFKSFDGGQVWTSSLIPGYPQDTSKAGLDSPIKGYQAGADPTVRSGNNGLFYYSGIAFNRGANAPSAVFVSRFLDNNNAPGGDSIAYLDTQILATATKKPTGTQPQFVDKPVMVVDVPRDGAKTCSISAPGAAGVQKIPAGTIYVAYMLFQNGPTQSSKLMVMRSLDCGATWSKASTASTQNHANQGVAMGIDPASGALYLAWRVFADAFTGDAIMFTKTVDLGRTTPDPPSGKGKATDPEPLKFMTPQAIATIKPFDQGDSATTFRTNSYPSVAVDGAGRAYVAFAERGWGPAGATATAASTTAPAPGDARIVVMTGVLTDKNTKGKGDDNRQTLKWSDRRPIDNHPDRGHQIMPAASIVAGRLTVVFKDFRTDASGVFNLYVDDADIHRVVPARRHTLDVRVSQALVPADTPAFAASVAVSQYLRGSKPGSRTIEQLQFNPPNLPLYAQGTTPFVGDYLDLAGQTMVPDGSGGWAFNTGGGGPGAMFAFWTDNRDVRPPLDGDWKHYTPPTSALTEQTCAPGQTGMRNANIYSARISPGLLVGSPENFKRLSGTTRSFVTFAQNNTDTIRRYRFTIANQPPGGQASFLQFSLAGQPLLTVDATLAPRSTAARTVYVTSSNPTASVTVNVVEVQVSTTSTPPPVPNGLTGTIVLNPDITNPDITNPDITNLEVFNPDITNPDITNPDITNPDITNPDITNPDITNVVAANPDITNPDITNPDITNPDITNPDITNPDITNPDITNGAYVDVTWTVTNKGNTAGAFAVTPLLAKAAPARFKLQLLIYKTYKTQVTVTGGCTSKTQSQTVLLANIVNPDITNPDITNKPTNTARSFAAAAPVATASAGIDFNETDPSLSNVTIWLEPGESASIALRVLAPDRTQLVTKQVTDPDGTVRTVFVDPTFDPSVSASVAVQSEAVGTKDVANGVTNPPVDIALIIDTTSLPAGTTITPYDQILAASGGSGPRTWQVSSGALPTGLVLNASTGEIAGTPTTAGSFTFTVTVTDTAVPMHVTSEPFIVNISNGVNQVPSFTKGLDQTVNEDSGLTTAANWATAISPGAGEAGQLVNFLVSNDNNALFAVQPAVSPAGTLTFQPAADANGSATVTVKIRDNGGTANGGVDTSAPQTFTITVSAVNDAPSFVKGPDVTVDDNSGPVSIPNWATALSAGPADESGQSLSFIVTPSIPGFFQTQPAISSTGTLTFETEGVTGNVTVTVQIRDNGGTANGGIDTSAAQTFEISVVATGNRRELVPLLTDLDPVPLSNNVGIPDGSRRNQAGDYLFWNSASVAGVFLRRAGSSTVTPIIQGGDPLPGLANSSANSLNGMEMNASGLVALRVDAISTAVVLTYDGTSLRTIVSGFDVAPGTGGRTFQRNLAIGGLNDLGDLVVSSNLVNPNAIPGGVPAPTVFFVRSGGTPVRVAGPGDVLPGTGGGVLTGATGSQVNNLGDVLFVGTISGGTGGQGLFVWNSGTIRKVVTNGDSAGAAGTFPSVAAGILNSSGQVAFVALNSVWVNTPGSGNANQGAAGTALSAPLGGTLAATGTPVLVAFDDSGDAAFTDTVTGGAGGSGLFRCRTGGVVDVVAYVNQTPPGASTTIRSFVTGTMSMNKFGTITFRAESATSSNPIGLYQAAVGGSLTKIVLATDTTPLGGTYNLFTLGTSDGTQTMDDGSVVFRADVPGGSTDFGEFLYSGGTVTTLLSTADVLPAGLRIEAGARSFSMSASANGDYITFLAGHSGGRPSIVIYRISTRALSIVATDGDSLIGGRIRLGTPFLGVNAAGQVPLQITPVGGPSSTIGALFMASPSAGLVKIAANGDTDSGGRTLGTPRMATGTSYTTIPLNDAGQVVFSAAVNGGTRGLFVGTPGGTAVKLAINGDSVGGQPITSIGGLVPIINNGGKVLFFSNTAAGANMIVGVPGGALTKIARVGDASPSGGTFATFAQPSFNNSDEIAFMASATSGPTGIFLASATTAPVVLATNGTTSPAGPNYIMTAVLPDVIINDQHDVVFLSDLQPAGQNPPNAAYFMRRGANGPIQPIVMVGVPAPGTGGVPFSMLLHTINSTLGEFFQLASTGDVMFSGRYNTGDNIQRIGNWHIGTDNGIEKVILRGETMDVLNETVAFSQQDGFWVSFARYPIFVGLAGGDVHGAIFLFESPSGAATPVGTNVVVNPTDPTTRTAPVTLTFDQVAQAGFTTVASASGLFGTTFAVPPAYVSGSPQLFFALETSAQFNGLATICIDVGTVSFPAGSTLKLLMYNGSGWQDITTSGPVGGVVCGRTSVMSIFTVARLGPEPLASLTGPPAFDVDALLSSPLERRVTGSVDAFRPRRPRALRRRR